MIKTYAKYDADKGRTIAISANGTTRWITPEMNAEILSWRNAGGSRYAAVLGGTVSDHIREFDLYESPAREYVIRTHDAAIDILEIVSSNLALIDMTARYRNDPRWQAI